MVAAAPCLEQSADQAHSTRPEPARASERSVARGLPAPRPSRVPVLRRCACGAASGSGAECAECRSKKLRRDLAGREGVGAGESVAPPAVHAVLATQGAPIEPPVRRRLEDRLGQGLASVRLHRDEHAAESARAVNALAYTVGERIVFGAGRYAPQTADGERLLVHELAHVVQSRRSSTGDGTRPLIVGSPAAAEEREADAMARTARPATSRPAPSAAARGRLRRFASAEHVEIGTRALPGQTANILGYGPVPVGELIAMSGDYFESMQQIQDLAHQGASGRAEIDCARHKVTTNGGTCADPVAEAAVSSRYEQLAARNWTHFTTGSPSGQSNRDLYIDYHTRAIRSAWLAGLSPMTTQLATPEALEGFGLHYLTDAFSAGHVRTPRAELRNHWNGIYPDFAAHLITMIACYMASYLRDEEHLTTPVGVLVSGVHLGVVDVPGIEDAIRARAGSRLANFGIGDIISMAMHDADNAGLDVVSPGGPAGSAAGPYHWRAVGDSQLFPPAAGGPATLTGVTPAPAGPTQTMVVEAVQRSWAEVRAARTAGSSSAPMPSVTPASFTALQLVPQADPASTTNPTYGWRVPNIRALPALTQSIIAAEFKPGQQIANQLGGFTMANCESQHHVGSAWRCFMRLLRANPFEMIARACEGTTCPPGNNNPCTSPREPLVPTTPCP